MKHLSLELLFFLGIVFLFIFFLSRWIIRASSMAKVKKSLLPPIIISFILTPLAYFLYVKVFISVISYEENNRFTKLKWDTEVSKRWTMRKDIVDKKVLIGKDSLEIRALIGDPSVKDSTINKWTYNLGSEKAGLGLVFYYMDVKYENGKVKEVKSIDIAD